MDEKREFPLKVVPGGQTRLEALHDVVMELLDTQEKKGIRQLLKKNNDSCKKLIFPYVESGQDRATIMIALTGILEAHARECYAIGYLDCIANRKQDRIVNRRLDCREIRIQDARGEANSDP